MSNNKAIDYRNSKLVHDMGIDALTKELGPVGMAHFIQQLDRGEGDYTAERDEMLANATMETLLDELEAIRKQKQ